MKYLAAILLMISAPADDAVAADDSRVHPKPVQSTADALARNHIFGEGFLSEDLFGVLRRAARLSDVERFDFLADWVLPKSTRPNLRMVGTAASLHPSPASDPLPPGGIEVLESPGVSRVQTGGHLVSPAAELVAVARRLGRLGELRQRIESLPAVRSADAIDPTQQRARVALLALIDIADEQWEAANDRFSRLYELIRDGDADLRDRWPELLAVDEGLRRRETFESARELVAWFYEQLADAQRRSGDEAWDRQMWALCGRVVVHSDVDVLPRTGRSPIRQWSPVSHATAWSRGLGFPQCRWKLSPKEVSHLAGHNRDFLYFQSPLSGDFDVECELTSFHWRETQLAYAGTWIAPFYDHHQYRFGSLRDSDNYGTMRDVEPPLTPMHAWLHYRLRVRDGRLTVFFNGRKVHEQPLAPQHDPWLAVRSDWLLNGGVRDLRITGAPEVPAEVHLAASEDLPGWLPYFDESVGNERPYAVWRLNDGELVGRRRPEIPGETFQSLLQYHRPMLEDGTIEYEFFYDPQTAQVHPALDRLAFLLHPDGVRIHWVTDGKYERTELDPANAFVDRRDPERLPLKTQDWNRLRLTLAGDTITLALNGTQVYQRKLEPTNMRTFGLFRYANRSAARVRNLVWRGDWPRELPALAQQELADVDLVAKIDAGLPGLNAVFAHDFSKPLPRDMLGNSTAHEDIRIESDGVHVVRRCPGDDRYHSFASLFRIAGDFDITASFDQFQSEVIPESETGSDFALVTTLNTPRRDEVHIARGQHYNGNQKFVTAHRSDRPDGTRDAVWKDYVHDGRSGTFRIARRGATLYLLFADGDSTQFRVLDQHALSRADVDLDGVQLVTHVFGEGGTISAVWKQLTVRAEAIRKAGSLLAAALSPPKEHRSARYVRIELPGPDRMLSLAEVQVISNGRNVAEAKPAKQSSTSWDGPAKLAVDGVTNGHYYAARSTTHTNMERNPWWEVDLGEAVPIDSILVWNRFDGGLGVRLQGFRVQLLDEKRRIIWEKSPALQSSAGR